VNGEQDSFSNLLLIRRDFISLFVGWSHPLHTRARWTCHPVRAELLRSINHYFVTLAELGPTEPRALPHSTLGRYQQEQTPVEFGRNRQSATPEMEAPDMTCLARRGDIHPRTAWLFPAGAAEAGRHRYKERFIVRASV